MDPVVILLIIVISVITILLVVVGIHIVQILTHVKKTIEKTNHLLDHVNGVVGHIHSPFGKQGSLVEGLKTGLNLAQAFAHWLSTMHLTDDSKMREQTRD